MTETEFGYYVRGLVGTTASTAEISTFVLRAAQNVLELKPTSAAQTVMTPLPVPKFCMHNVNVAEQCGGCGFTKPDMRFFAFPLSVSTKHVYIPKP